MAKSRSQAMQEAAAGAITISQHEYGLLMDFANKLSSMAIAIGNILVHSKAMGPQAPVGTPKAAAPTKKGTKLSVTQKKGSKLGKGKKTKRTVQTPMGKATAPMPHVHETKIAGRVYSTDDLETMNRRDLAIIARPLGIDTKGFKAADLRSAIVGAQISSSGKSVGADTASGEYFVCDVTGDEVDTLMDVKDGEGNVYGVGPAVQHALQEGAVLDDFISGDDEPSNYA